jgi:F-type H+-transporting ATPase subunit b
MSEVAHEAANAAHQAAEGSSGGFPPFDATLYPHQLFWFFISFFGLYFLLANVIIPRIAKVIAARKSAVEGDLKKAADETAAAEEAKKAAELAQHNARDEARSTLDNMRKKLEDDAAKAQAKALAEADEKIQSAVTVINEQKTKAIEEVSESIYDIAGDIFTSITGKKPTATLLKSAMKGAN